MLTNTCSICLVLSTEAYSAFFSWCALSKQHHLSFIVLPYELVLLDHPLSLYAALRRRTTTFIPVTRTLMTRSPRSSTSRSDRWPAAIAVTPLPQRKSLKPPSGRSLCRPTEVYGNRLGFYLFFSVMFCMFFRISLKTWVLSKRTSLLKYLPQVLSLHSHILTCPKWPKRGKMHQNAT